MKNIYITTFLCSLIFTTTQSSEQSLFPHAFITNWHQTSYGSFIPQGKEHKPLPILVQISFDKIINKTEAENFLKYLIETIKLFDPSIVYDSIRHKPGSYIIKIQPFIHKEQFQRFLDQTNKYFDSSFKTENEKVLEKNFSDLEQKEFNLQNQQATLIEQEELLKNQKIKLEEEKQKLFIEKNNVQNEKNRLTSENYRLAQDKLKLEENIKKLQQELSQIKSQSINQITNKQIPVNIPISQINLPGNNANNFDSIRNSALNNLNQKAGPTMSDRFQPLSEKNTKPGSSNTQLWSAENDLKIQLTGLEAQYNFQNQTQQTHNYHNLLQTKTPTEFEYNMKLQYFSQYIMPTVAERFQSSGARGYDPGPLNSTSLRNQVRLAGKDIGLNEKDIDIIIKQRFGI